MRLLFWMLICLCAAAVATCSDEATTEPALSDQPAAGSADEAAATPRPDGVRISQIAAGGARTCALTVEGEVVCWGGGDGASQNLRAPLTNYRGAVGPIVQLAVGVQDACALVEGNGLICWRHSGEDQSVLARPEQVPGSYMDISVGASHACGIRTDRSIRCWPSPGDTGADLVEQRDGQFADVAAGDGFICAVEQSGAASCWRLDGASTLPAPAGSFTAISAGGGHVCAVTDDQRLRCWGENGNGQAEPPPGRYTAASASDSHTCALTLGAELDYWGDNWKRHTTPPPGEWRALTGGGQHFCALRDDDTASCWGYPARSWDNSRMAFPSGRWTAVDVGPLSFCALSESEEVACYTAAGGIATGRAYGPWTKFVATRNRPCMPSPSGFRCVGGYVRHVPRSLPDRWRATPIVDLASGSGGICALFDGGAIRCWKDSTGIVSGPPGEYVALSSIVYEYMCAIDVEQRVRCGVPGGPLGAAPIPPAAYVAVSVASLSDRSCEENGSLECSEPAACALTDQGDVTCWGKWTGETWTAPDGPFSAVAVSDGMGCGLRPSGGLECWSSDGVEPTPRGQFVDVDVGPEFSCAVRVDGAIHCWHDPWTRGDWRDRPEVLIPAIDLAIDRYEAPSL